MTAHFYILAESFRNNKKLSTSEIEEKVKRLSEDINLMSKHKSRNRIYTNYKDIYPQLFYSNYTVSDFICSSQQLRKEGVDRDVINALNNIIVNNASETTITSSEVKQTLIDWNDEDNCHGLIAFQKVEDIENSFQVIYGIDGWYKFRRHFLGIYPKNGDYFIDECSMYFPKLTFHIKNRETVKKILFDFSKSILKHLGHLNDTFYFYRYRTFNNESEKYLAFSIECQLEEYAASKDANSTKELLTFDFLDTFNQYLQVTCYPHLRLCTSDNTGDNKYYYNRIYFHEGLPSISANNILIGHIGSHI